MKKPISVMNFRSDPLPNIFPSSWEWVFSLRRLRNAQEVVQLPAEDGGICLLENLAFTEEKNDRLCKRLWLDTPMRT
jgi:hypothetical protein